VRTAVVWSSAGGVNGTLTWIPEDFLAVPTECVCGARLQVTEVDGDGSALALECERHHKWRDSIRMLEERFARRYPGADR
jgi:hypothetical protein